MYSTCSMHNQRIRYTILQGPVVVPTNGSSPFYCVGVWMKSVWFTCCSVLNNICKAAYRRPCKRISMVIYIRLNSSSRLILNCSQWNKIYNTLHVRQISRGTQRVWEYFQFKFCICEQQMKWEQWQKFAQVV